MAKYVIMSFKCANTNRWKERVRRLTMDMSCCTTTVPYWLTYSLHYSERKKKVNTNILRKKYALNKNSPLLEGPHHWRQGRSQLVTLVLNILNERVYKWGVGLCFCLSISQKLDAVLANSIIFLQKRPHLGSRGKIWLLMWVHVNFKKVYLF